MNKLHVTFIIATQVLLIFLYVHHQSTLTKLSYTEQKHQNKLTDLHKQKKELQNTYTIQKDLATIKRVSEKRHFKKMHFSHINSLDAI
jgi:peptidoglycan hydrolase CwlO-like protein